MRTLLACCLIVLFFSCNKDDDNQAPPVNNTKVNVNDLTVDEGDSGSKTIFVQVQLSQSATKEVTVKLNTTNGTAEAAEDYVAISDASLSFQVGDQVKEIELQINGDEESEANETFNVVAVEATGAAIDKGTGVVTISNDDGGIGGGDIFIPGGATSPLEYPGMTLLWQDEFDGAAVDAANWTCELGNGNSGWGNNELQYYRKENAAIYEGHLVITAKEESFGGKDYTSARMITKDKFDFKYGRVDIRANLPKGQGIWPALWMLGSNFSSVGWPSCGEVDIMELIGHQASKVYGTGHWSAAGELASWGGNTDLSSGIFNDEFHIFSIVWDESGITWLLDDVEYHSLSTTGSELTEFHENFFFIFNVAVGGNWPGSPDGSTVFPQRMIVDYIRVFQ